MTLRRILAMVGLTVLVVLVSAAAASAHPLGNFTVNRAAGLQLSPGRLQIDYVVDLAEIPTRQERSAIDRDADGRLSGSELDAWAADAAMDVSAGLEAAVDGRAVALRVTCARAETSPGQGGLPVLRLEAGIVGWLPERGRLQVTDTNDPGRLGWREITASATGGVDLASSTVPSVSPSDRLRAYPEDLLSSPPNLRRAEVVFAPGTSVAEHARPCAGAVPASPTSSGGFAALLGRDGSLPLLLAAMALALGFGALHALGPGHGKTLMAGYLVGAGARFRDAVAVGLAVAVMHTASVLALGVLVLGLERTFRPERVYPVLGLASGLLALALGAVLLTRRLAVWAEGRSSRDLHTHDHGSGSHRHPEPDGPVLSRRGLVGLAVAGGILPSPTALLVLLSAVSLERIGFGLALIAAFSLGLAAALVAVGAFTMRVGDAIGARLSSGAGRIVPVLSSTAVVVVGLVLTVRGLSEL